MPFTDMYRKQVELLVQTLPQVAEEECCALKGGTAINLFVRDWELILSNTLETYDQTPPENNLRLRIWHDI